MQETARQKEQRKNLQMHERIQQTLRELSAIGLQFHIDTIRLQRNNWRNPNRI